MTQLIIALMIGFTIGRYYRVTDKNVIPRFYQMDQQNYEKQCAYYKLVRLNNE